MKTAKEHYDSHLAAVYDWMAGGFDAAAARNREFFARTGLESLPRGLAVDLGAGSGFQTIPLAEMGFPVLAVDFSVDLLAALEARKGTLAIRTAEDDLLNFQRHLNGQEPHLIVCMGDTLTHLESLADVRRLLAAAAAALPSGGVLILSFRDYVSSEPEGIGRFIPVRSDEALIFTCFLEYFAGHVEVHDLLYTKKDSGWTFSASSYTKLRLDPEFVAGELRRGGFSSVHRENENGMVKIVAKR